jgi:hypothetical protein
MPPKASSIQQPNRWTTMTRAILATNPADLIIQLFAICRLMFAISLDDWLS